MTKTKKTNVKVKSYTRKDGTRVRSSQRSIETNNIRNTYELQRRRKGRELLRDIGSDLTLGLIKPSELTRKRTSVRKAQAAGVLLNRVDRRGLSEATRVATNDYKINPNSKKALAEINKLENRARIAGTKPERYRKLAALYEKEMEKGGYQGMKYRGTDFSGNSNTNTRIEFKRGKDKKKRKKRSNRKEAIIAAASIGGGARIGGLHGFIRGRGGLGGSKTVPERTARIWTQSYDKLVGTKTSNKVKKEFIKDFADNSKGRATPSELKNLGKELNKRGRKMAIKHAAIGAGIGATAYGGYRAIKALRNKKKNK